MTVRAQVQQRETQRKAQPAHDVHTVAASGVAGAGGTLPYASTIQHSFGHHDVSGIRAHTGSAARDANTAMGSLGYATGNDVAFGRSPSLHTAAHEAAHIIQQRAGVQLKGGVGQVGDVYERHADAVADRVVQGKSAESLLDQFAGGGGSHAIQRRSVQFDERAGNRGTTPDQAQPPRTRPEEPGHEADRRSNAPAGAAVSNADFDAKQDEITAWARQMRDRTLQNCQHVVTAFHRLGEHAQWDVAAFNSIEANVVCGILTAVGMVPGGGTAVAAVAGLIYNVYSTAQNNAALRAALSAATGQLHNEMIEQGRIAQRILRELDTDQDRLTTTLRDARDAGDAGAVHAITPNPDFVRATSVEAVYSRLSAQWLMRNSAANWNMMSADEIGPRDGVSSRAWSNVRQSNSTPELANRGADLMVGQLEGLCARFGLEQRTPITAGDMADGRQFTGLRIVNQGAFTRSMDSGVYFALSRWAEPWEFEAGIRIREGLAVNGTRSLEYAWVQHGSAIRENATSGNNVRRVSIGSGA